MKPSGRSSCRRCEGPNPDGNPWRGFCSRAHADEARAQLRALEAAGPGCGRCYRGAIFFRWREEGGRLRVPASQLEHRHAAPCWCPAGDRIELPGGYKTWGFMRDLSPEGELELAPRRSLLARLASTPKQ